MLWPIFPISARFVGRLMNGCSSRAYCISFLRHTTCAGRHTFLTRVDCFCRFLPVCRAASTQQESTECSEIRAAAAYLCEHFCQPLSLADCAARLHLSVSRFSHLFTKTIGVSPYQYLLRLRLDQACALLLHTELDIRHIAQLVGFDDPSYFSRLFRKRFGENAGAFRTAYSQELSEHPASALPVL